MNQKEYDKGYQEALDAIRKQLQNQGKSGSQQTPSGQPQQGNDGRMMPPGMDAPSSSAAGGDPSQGQAGNEKMDANTNGNPGGFIDRSLGKKIAKAEGYDDNGPGDDMVYKDWKDTALKSAKTWKSKGGGKADFGARLEAIHKSSKDWKAVLKRIVGRSINPDSPRRAYANKNILVSQDRIARTDKDKYNNMDYMVAMVDTSGSMSHDDIKACLQELYAVALAKKPLKLVLMYFGSGVSQLQIFNNLNEFKKEMRSPNVRAGGGTEVAPCFNLLKTDPRFKTRPADLIMIFTDGYIDQVRRDPKRCNYLCWVIVDNPSFDLQYRDGGKTMIVHVKKEDMKR